MTWQAAEKVQKNSAGQYRAMINGQWTPVSKAQKNNAGQYRVMIEPEQQPAQEMPKPDGGFSISETVKNIPSSAMQLASDIATPILHPIDTAKSIYGLARGAVDKALPSSINGVEFGETDNERSLNAVGGFLKDRYGSTDALKNTLQNDPVGMLSDVAGVLSMGAGMVPKVGRVGSIAGGIQKLGMAIDPINITANALKYGAGKMIPAALPAAMYERAAKFSTVTDKTARNKMIATALREQIMPTGKGLDKLNDVVRSTSSQIDDLINAAEKSGKRIPRKDLFKHIDALRKELGGVDNIDAAGDLAKINKVVSDYSEYLVKKGRKTLTPTEVQSLKKRIYEKVSYDASKMKGNYAKDKTRKAIARAARESIEGIDPSISGLNERAGDLLDIRDALTRSANRIDNRDFIGLDPTTKIVPAAMVGGDAGAMLGTAVAIGSLPKVQAKGALMAELLRGTNAGQFLNNSMTPMMLRQALIQGGRATEASQQ